MNIFEKLWFRAKTGYPIEDLGVVEEVVIRYKDKYISILENEDGDIKSLTWTENVGFMQTPIRDFWLATPPEQITDEDIKKGWPRL